MCLRFQEFRTAVSPVDVYSFKLRLRLNKAITSVCYEQCKWLLKVVKDDNVKQFKELERIAAGFLIKGNYGFHGMLSIKDVEEAAVLGDNWKFRDHWGPEHVQEQLIVKGTIPEGVTYAVGITEQCSDICDGREGFVSPVISWDEILYVVEFQRGKGYLRKSSQEKLGGNSK